MKCYSKPLCIILMLLMAVGGLIAADKSNELGFDVSRFSEKPLFENEPVKVELVAEDTAIQPGRPFWVALKATIDKGWHTYWKNPGDTGIASSVEWFVPPGFKVEELQWPVPKRYTDGQTTYYGYEDSFILLAKITPPKDLKELSGKRVEIGAIFRWVACTAEACLPGDLEPSINLPLIATEPPANAENTSLFTSAREHMPRSDWGVTAQYVRPGVISITVIHPNMADLSTVAALFLPEQQKMVDTKQRLKPMAVLPKGSYQVLLHSRTEPTRLSGILILEHRVGEKFVNDAIAVDVPIQHPALIPGLDLTRPSALLLVLFFAFLGGLILNLMPCVLPVIGVKVLSLIKHAGESRRAIMRHGLLFSAGVLVSFWLLAGILLGLKAYGHSVGWGFQLQEPLFVGGLAAVLLVFSLSLFGVFEFGSVFASWAGHREHKSRKHGNGLLGSFLGGVLATAVATPCTGPFLGTAVGLAVTLPPAASLIIFTFIGLGMSSPYLLLTVFPHWSRWLPRPGTWMIHFKQFMGFLMLGTVLWLIWVFSAHTHALGIIALLMALFVLAVGCWVYGSWSPPHYRSRTRILSTICSVLLIIMGAFLVVDASRMQEPIPVVQGTLAEENEWQPYSKELLAQLRAEGRPVFIDFTAKWCLICQANHYILEVDAVRHMLAEKGVVKLKADWTRSDPSITEVLREHGRSGVPLYLLYLPGAETPEILPQVLTPEIVMEYLRKIG